jgi:dihydropteroate synthase
MAAAPAPVQALEAVWRVRSHELALGPIPLLMGVVNVTPDSFSDGGSFLDVERAIERGRALAAAGAAILDVGGESTRPGADSVPLELELERTLPVVEGLARSTHAAISIDTTKLEVARAALEAGASILNDVSALRFAPGIAKLAAEAGAGLVLMHMKGEPRTMQRDPRYDDLVGEVAKELAAAAAAAQRAGVPHEAIVVDPGIGFGKTPRDSWRLIVEIGRFSALGYPVLVGHSRKTFLDPDKRRPPRERIPESLAAGLLAALNGARILRVHDVDEHARMLTAYERYLEAGARGDGRG